MTHSYGAGRGTGLNDAETDRSDVLYFALRSHRRAVLWLGGLLPLVLIAVGGVLIWVWLPELPNPAATHWSSGPEPDGFGSPSTYLGLQLGLGGGLAVVLSGIAYGTEYGSPGAFTGRWLAIANLAMAGFMGVSMCWSVAMQRGLHDAHEAESATPSDVVAAGAALVLGLGAWLILRVTNRRLSAAREERVALGGPGAPEGDAVHTLGTASASHVLPVAPGERVMWSRTVTMGRVPLAVVGAALLLALGAGVRAAFTDRSALWVTGPVVGVVVLAVASCLTFRVTIGPGGMTVRSLVGLPRARVPAGSVASARAVDVDPFAQFGGWGWRFGAGGAVGFVLRKGPGLEVRSKGGRRVVVTIDDAAEAAAVLRAMTAGAVAGGVDTAGGNDDEGAV